MTVLHLPKFAMVRAEKGSSMMNYLYHSHYAEELL